MDLINSTIYFLASLTFFSDILLVILFIYYIFNSWSSMYLHRKPMAVFGKHWLFLAWIVALTATMGSLFFSEVAGLEPCELCWFQRIFMYPMTIMLGIAWYRDEDIIKRYIFPLAVIGGIIASYHYYLHLFPEATSLVCTVDSPDSCSFAPFKYFGYITIPMMNLTANAMILVLSSVSEDTPNK